MIEASFWLSVLAILHTYVGYPLLIWIWATLRPRPPRTSAIEPSVCVVVPAYNEARWIARRLQNLSDLDYPRERLQIILASDGSTDATVELARASTGAMVRVLDFPNRRGKPSVLNDAVESTRAEVIVFADARQVFEPGALRALVRAFADPDVGAVSGELMLRNEGAPDTAVAQGTSGYWRYEKFLRIHESLRDSAIGATGAIYAIRRDLFEPFPPDVLLDDVWLPMRIVRRGRRVVFDRDARAWDRASTGEQEEFLRKVRTIGGTFQLLRRERWLLNPFANRLWFEVLSHKGLRLVSPPLLFAAAVTNVLLWDRFPYSWLLAGQAAFYAAALCGFVLRTRVNRLVLSLPYVFCILNWATVVAFVRTAAGRQRVTWEKISAEDSAARAH